MVKSVARLFCLVLPGKCLTCMHTNFVHLCKRAGPQKIDNKKAVKGSFDTKT